MCNPNNPVGKIWEKETLRRIGELCVKHHVTVLSDEIHCDLTAPGMEYTPFDTPTAAPTESPAPDTGTVSDMYEITIRVNGKVFPAKLYQT